MQRNFDDYNLTLSFMATTVKEVATRKVIEGLSVVD
jgi:hypothetical protein